LALSLRESTIKEQVMRVTNQIITNKTLSNINDNKNRLMTVEEQYQTGKKIQKPSDDPVIAVRALKLRNSLGQITQFYKKNVPDAKNWMSQTESALKNDGSILTDLKALAVKGTQDTLTTPDRDKIYETMVQYRDQIYIEGNGSYAGRYLFTGYKTQTSLLYLDEDHSKQYTITQEFKSDDIRQNTVTVGGYATGDDFSDTTKTKDDYKDAPQNTKSYIVKLAYDKTDKDVAPTISYTYKDSTGATQNGSVPHAVTATAASTDKDAYEAPANGVKYLADTGELVFSDTLAKDILAKKGNFTVNFQKTEFEKNDLRPEHYFTCTSKALSKEAGKAADGSTIPAEYNGEEIKYTVEDQDINYEVGFNQRLNINLQAKECLTHDLGRELDGIIYSIDAVKACENRISDVKKHIETVQAQIYKKKQADPSADVTTDQTQLDKFEKIAKQLDVELVLKKKVMQERFSVSIDKIEDFQTGIDTALANLGAREKRLNLTLSRLEEQSDDSTELMSNNEDANMTDTIIHFGAAQNVYNASLNAGAKVIQNSLLDFIS